MFNWDFMTVGTTMRAFNILHLIYRFLDMWIQIIYCLLVLIYFMDSWFMCFFMKMSPNLMITLLIGSIRNGIIALFWLCLIIISIDWKSSILFTIQSVSPFECTKISWTTYFGSHMPGSYRSCNSYWLYFWLI